MLLCSACFRRCREHHAYQLCLFSDGRPVAAVLTSRIPPLANANVLKHLVACLWWAGDVAYHLHPCRVIKPWLRSIHKDVDVLSRVGHCLPTELCALLDAKDVRDAEHGQLICLTRLRVEVDAHARRGALWLRHVLPALQPELLARHRPPVLCLLLDHLHGHVWNHLAKWLVAIIHRVGEIACVDFHRLSLCPHCCRGHLDHYLHSAFKDARDVCQDLYSVTYM
mmetsp:Transcript_10902/g.18556  ORF Transcript_10902/g.18556 Transcript_10902/m.18556 type:complete len:224 (+) Transcript_10902:440-1111(+)